MEATLKSRLKEYLNFKNFSDADFQNKTGVSRSYISTLKDTITSKTQKKIAKAFPDLNMDWLISGNGDMLQATEQIKERFFRYLDYKGLNDDVFQKLIDRSKNTVVLYLDEFLNNDFNFISHWKNKSEDFGSIAIKFVTNVLKYNNINDLDILWLLTGKSEMITGDNIENILRGREEELRNENEKLKEEIKRLTEKISHIKNK
jgi:transcriptional regulator with XRE-family HTH domain